MRIIFVDPHLNTCGKNFFHFVRKNKSYSKYGYLIKHALGNGIKVGFFIENSLGLNKTLFTIFIYIWCLGNGFNFLKINILFDKNELRRDDVLFSFIFKILESSIIKDFNGKKIIHTTHYGLNTSKIAKLLKKISNYIFIGENNLKKNSPYFRKFFQFYNKEFYVLNFTYQKRFANYTEKIGRLNKCFALGTLQDSLKILGAQSRDIINFVGKDTAWHPMRKIIYDNQNNIKNEIDCHIYQISEWKKYLSFNVVKLFNTYTMFVVPEEIFDLPGISMAEGMACGCAYIGKIDPMYTDIGMIADVHYIGYNGTIEDLIEKIKFYQKNTYELEKIAHNGYIFALNNFKPDMVARKFYNHFLK